MPVETKIFNIMNRWIKLQPNHVKAYLADDQLNLLRTMKVYHGDEDPLLLVIKDVTEYIRCRLPEELVKGKIESAVPMGLKMAACLLVVEALQSRIPELSLTSDQVRNANNGRKYIAEIVREINSVFDNANDNRISTLHYRKPIFRRYSFSGT